MSRIGNSLGRGFGFPFGVGEDGRLRWSEGTRNVRESLRVILLTEPGERVRRREFGAGLDRLLFEPNNPSTRRLVQDRIVRAIQRWEPRVRIESVEVRPTEDPSRVQALVRYLLVSDGRRESVTLDIDLEG